MGPLSPSITKVEARGLLGERRISKAAERKVRVTSRSKTKFSRRLLSVSISICLPSELNKGQDGENETGAVKR